LTSKAQKEKVDQLHNQVGTNGDQKEKAKKRITRQAIRIDKLETALHRQNTVPHPEVYNGCRLDYDDWERRIRLKLKDERMSRYDAKEYVISRTGAFAFDILRSRLFPDNPLHFRTAEEVLCLLRATFGDAHKGEGGPHWPKGPRQKVTQDFELHFEAWWKFAEKQSEQPDDIMVVELYASLNDQLAAAIPDQLYESVAELADACREAERKTVAAICFTNTPKTSKRYYIMYKTPKKQALM
jgi:hypothetical protein